MLNFERFSRNCFLWFVWTMYSHQISDILTQAIRRGLVSTPPSHMIGDERENLRVNAWIRGGKNQGLFMPYYEETKVLLEDRMSPPQHLELMRMRRTRQHIPDIPDTLYMVSRINAAAGGVGGVGNGEFLNKYFVYLHQNELNFVIEKVNWFVTRT